jgi:hypothetical protein
VFEANAEGELFEEDAVAAEVAGADRHRIP